MVFKKIRKSHVDWRDFLCGTPASDYIFQKDAYEEQIENAVNFIKDADAVIIGAGAGASTAAGLEYGGKRFTDHFAEFIEKYGGHYMTDMYAAGFYPFPSEEADGDTGRNMHCSTDLILLHCRFIRNCILLLRTKTILCSQPMWITNFIKQDFQQKKYLRHRVITERFSVREDAIQRLMTQKNYSERWMPGEGTV